MLLDALVDGEPPLPPIHLNHRRLCRLSDLLATLKHDALLHELTFTNVA